MSRQKCPDNPTAEAVQHLSSHAWADRETERLYRIEATGTGRGRLSGEPVAFLSALDKPESIHAVHLGDMDDELRMDRPL